MATSDGELVLEGLEWPPSCGLSEDEQCEAIFCNGLQAYLQDTLCDNPGDCKLAVVCDPKIPKRANRALQATDRKFTFIISLFVECTTTPDCSDIATEETAAEAAMLAMNQKLEGITAQQLLDGVKAAIAQANPPAPAGDFYSTFTITYDPASAMLSDPSIVLVPTNIAGPFEFVGEGNCRDSFDWGYSFIDASNDKRPLTLAECADWVSAAATSACWVDNELILGFESRDNDRCRILFDQEIDYDICPLPEGSGQYLDFGNGAGPIAFVNDNQGVLCYKYAR